MTVPCRTFIAGFGVPTQRDLDIGRQVIRSLEPFTWPAGVVVEDLPCAPTLALHRVHELGPAKLVLVGANQRGVDAPGTVRRRSIDPTEVHLDHTLTLLRRWGGLPADTVLIEVEPADCSFGTGFSDELAPCFDEILSLLQDELGEDGPVLTLAPDDFLTRQSVTVEAAEHAVPEAMAGLVDYAARRREAKLHERHRGHVRLAPERLPADCGLLVAGRSRPWSIGLESGSDWYDVIPLEHGTVGVVLGDVPGRGVDATALKADLRVAVQAYAVLEGRFPARVVACLDRMAAATGRGELTTLAYLTVQPDTGEVRLCSAGQCPPLLVDEHGARFLHDSLTAPIGAAGAGHRWEITAELAPGATLLLYTDGLVRGPNFTVRAGQAALVDAALTAPNDLDSLCAHIVGACAARERRDDDVSLVAVRVAP